MPENDEPMVSTARLRSLRSALGVGDRPLLLVIHDYPDPDAIAAALAFQTLAGSWGVNSVIAYGGGIGREENAEMVRLLKIEMKTFSSIPDLSDFRGIMFLDTQPESKNQSAPTTLPILGIIDHHQLGDSVRLTPARRPGTGRILYSDVRLTVGASSTLAYGYLRTAGITPDVRLATALFLGIKTDTDGLLRDANPADVEAYTSLMTLSDLRLASRIIHPPLERSYFAFLHRALSNAVVYDATLLADCGDVETSDILSTISDMLISVKGVGHAMAAGYKNGRWHLSLRTRPPSADATKVLLQVVGPEGRGGGHGLSAGGFTPAGSSREGCFEDIRRRLLVATGMENAEGRNLI